MTNQPEPASTGTNKAIQVTKGLRELVALVLVGANALLLLVGVIGLSVPTWEGDTFTSRAADSFYNFAGLINILLPLVAVLLVTHIEPTPSQAKTITVMALAEYGFGGLFGVISLLGSFFGNLANSAFLLAFTGLLSRVAYLAVFAIAALLVVKVWQALFVVPKPKPSPAGFPGYGPQQGFGQPGYPQGGFTPAYGQQPGYPAGYQQAYGQPVQQPSAEATQVVGQPVVPGQPSAEATQPVGQPTVPSQPSAETTQVVGYGAPSVTPSPTPEPGYWGSERTQLLNPSAQPPSPPTPDGGDNPQSQQR